MTTKERINALQELGVSIKLLSNLSGVPKSTIYHLTANDIRNMSVENNNRIEKVLNKLEALIND